MGAISHNKNNAIVDAAIEYSLIPI